MSTCKLFIDVFIGLMELGELFLRNLYSLRIDHCDDSGNAFIPFNDSVPDLSAMHTRSFAVVGATTWNGLPVDLRHLPNRACSQFHHLLKTVLFRLAWVGSASEYVS